MATQLFLSPTESASKRGNLRDNRRDGISFMMDRRCPHLSGFIEHHPEARRQLMPISPEDMLSKLLEAKPRPTAEAPRDARGLYGLVDHLGELRYIGSTSSKGQTFYERIHRKHRTGSEGMSHYFSQMYNTGRMWRDRSDPATFEEGKIAKSLRNAFVADHCSAVWLSLPDTMDIASLEAKVLSIAPDNAIAWNRRKMAAYDEPIDLVDATLSRLCWGTQKIAALERQRQRFFKSTPQTAGTSSGAFRTLANVNITPFPQGPFRFFALDVETANNDRGSICQIGVACVRIDNSIETWVTFVDPQVDHWVFTDLHGISKCTVEGAPKFAEVLDVLHEDLSGAKVYQHSAFDRTAIDAACQTSGRINPNWDWQDSLLIARKAWPELRGNGGHGLASLKRHLGLGFRHHDAGEDARAAAEIVLRAEGSRPTQLSQPVVDRAENNVRLHVDEIVTPPSSHGGDQPLKEPSIAEIRQNARLIGKAVITPANLKNDHIYLALFFEGFPADAIGGSNRGAAAPREIGVDWGGGEIVMTDLDGSKKIFRKRGWIREFFQENLARPGDTISVEEVAPYRYRVSLCR
jgi:DNA polymerase III epsilon subunit-like protein